MNIFCITGLDSDAWISNIYENFKRQFSANINVKLIVVENGKGVGKWNILDPDVIVCQSQPGAAQYINQGLTVSKQLGKPGDWIVKFDSDDFYGPGRLSHIVTLSKLGFKAAGSGSIYVGLSNRKLLRVDAKTTPFETIPHDVMPHGPTLAAQIDFCLDFPIPAEKWGEDALWIDAMRNSGIEFGSFPLSGFCYMRHSNRDHSFPLSDLHLPHIWAADTYDEGLIDFDVINGYQSPAISELIPHDPFRQMDAMESLWEQHNRALGNI